jgi:hypothetical protein
MNSINTPYNNELEIEQAIIDSLLYGFSIQLHHRSGRVQTIDPRQCLPFFTKLDKYIKENYIEE